MSQRKKILMVSMPTLHFFRWVNQLKNEEYDVYWFDITDGGNNVSKISWVHQITNWKIKYAYPGRFFIKKRLPKIYSFFQKFNERDTATVFEKKLKQIKPDIVHSFALYVSCTPIISVMEKYPDVKWIYSSWGSDLFYFQHQQSYLADIKRVLPRVNYLFADCYRDVGIAEKHGFTGQLLDVLPGGGGFNLAEMKADMLPVAQRNTILIKGYQGRSGRAIPVLNALLDIKQQLTNFKIVVFGAAAEVLDYINTTELTLWSNFSAKGRMLHEEVVALMGQSCIYVGNSNSDGMPNTLLEAICMQVLPIQSNPGGVTEEVITHAANGYLIEDCDNVAQIQALLAEVLANFPTNYNKAINANSVIAEKLDYNFVKQQTLACYSKALYK